MFTDKVCINLDRRPDRWQRMQARLSQHGIESVRRFPALDGDTLTLPAKWIHTAGAYGCLLSHLQVVQQARESGAASVLIFEDDAVFDPELQTRFTAFMEEVPSDWDMLYFGALHKDAPIKIRDHVYRITKANSTYSYALKRTVFDQFIELNRRAEHVLDMNAYLLQERFNCYCFIPNLAWVEIEYSDVQNRLERHWYLEKSLVLFGAEVDNLLSRTAIILVHHGQGCENLMFLVRYYKEYFSPFIQIVIVEHDAGPFDRERCFQRGLENCDSNRTFFILSDSNVYLETLDIRANLRMCEVFDGATGFSEVIDLTPEQALRLRATGITRGIDVSHATQVKHTDSEYRFVRRDALDRSGEIRIFQSPNHALRLPPA